MEDIFLMVVFLIESVILVYFSFCAYRQYIKCKFENYHIIDLFPEECIYERYPFEDMPMDIDISDSKTLSTTQEYSIRIYNKFFFTIDEYMKYRKKVLDTILP